MKRLVVSTVLIAAALAYAFSSHAQGKLSFWLVIGGAYLVIAALGVHKLWDDGTLLDVFRLRGGDISIGLVIAAMLGLATWAARAVLASPTSPGQAWLFRIYLQLAAPSVVGKRAVLTLAIVLVALLEEISWRGFLQRLLEERFGTRRGWMLCAALYALVHVSTAFGLRDPAAGPNPLLVLAALTAGLCWGFTMRLMGRLPPVLVSHAAFAYFAVYQFSWIL